MQKTGLIVLAFTIAIAAQVNAQSATISVARFVTINGAINIGVEDIVGVEVDLSGDSSKLTLSLNKDASQALERLTSRSLGREMRFSVCDEEIIRPTVNVPVISGLAQVTLTEAEVLAMSEVLLGQINCSEYLQ